MTTILSTRFRDGLEDVAVALLAAGYIGGFVVMLEIALHRLLV
jgi:hypothetical protein